MSKEEILKEIAEQVKRLKENYEETVRRFVVDEKNNSVKRKRHTGR